MANSVANFRNFFPEWPKQIVLSTHTQTHTHTHTRKKKQPKTLHILEIIIYYTARVYRLR